MTKKLDATNITKDLEGSAFFAARPAGALPNLEPKAKQQSVTSGAADRTTAQRADQSVNQSVDRPVDQSLDRTPNRSVDQSTVQPARIVSRPKAFYITNGIDSKIDAAVRYFREKHGIKSVDRSTIVNALLTDEELWNEASLDGLVSRLISQLTSQLVE